MMQAPQRGSLIGLGRVAPPDRSNDYAFLIQASAKKAAGVDYKYWQSPKPYDDQGNTSQCVAYAGDHILAMSPVRNKKLNQAWLYHQCQLVDEWPGEDYDGTSVRALFRVFKRMGLFKEYRWAFDLETVVNFLLTQGPLVMGTDWHRDMFMPDRKGFISPTGKNDGGHAWVLDGANVWMKCPDGTVGAARALNSWGSNWGVNGRFWISFRDLQHLIEQDGEAAMGVELKLAA